MSFGKNKMKSRKEKERIAYHEVGHAVVGALLTDEPIHKISIVPRGIGALGYTLQLPTEDRYIMTNDELMGKICVLLGGRASEEVFFGNISTGAQNDLEKATDISRKMVTMYGMSEKIGLVMLEKPQNIYLSSQSQLDYIKNYSPGTAKLIDQEITRILTECYEKVKELLINHRESVKKIAEQLLKTEVMDEKTFKALLEKETVLLSKNR